MNGAPAASHEAAALEARRRGELEIRRRVQTDRERREAFNRNRNLENPMQNFTTEEQAILNGDPPPYTREERDADGEYSDLECPLSKEIPDFPDMVRWNGRIYSEAALTLLRNQAGLNSRNFRNPLDNTVLRRADFMGGDVHLTASQRSEVREIIASYEARATRRDARVRYDRLKQKLATFRNVIQGQAETISSVVAAGGDPRPSPPWINLQRRLRNEADVQMLGFQLDDDDPVDADPESPVNPAVVNLFDGPNPRRRINIESDNESVEEQAAPAVEPPNQDPIPGNPLDEDNSERTLLPSEFWGNQIIEVCFTNFMLYCEQLGWDTNLHRNKTAFLRENVASFFESNGSFSQ